MLMNIELSHRQLFYVTAFLLAISLSISVTNTYALDFYFSFTDDPSDDLGSIHVPGTVTGRVLGLTDNTSNQPAASVFLDSFPTLSSGTCTCSLYSSDMLGIDLASWFITPSFPLNANSFSVAGGNITAAEFDRVFTAPSGAPGSGRLLFDWGSSQESGQVALRFQAFAGPVENVIGNTNGMSAITFWRIPEPGTATLGLLGVAGLMRRRRAA